MKKILVIFFLLILINLSADPPDWQPIPGTQYSMLLMAHVYHQSNLFENNEENIVAAFGPGGETDCRAIGFWVDAYPPYYENGFWHIGIVSNIQTGEEISFKIYNSEQDQVFNCLQTVEFQDNTTTGSPYDPFILSTATGQIQGIIDLEGDGEEDHVLIEVDGLSTYPTLNNQEEWEYTLELPPGVYDVRASMLGYQDSLLTDVPVIADQITSGADFYLYQSENPLLYIPEHSYGALNQDIMIPVYIDIPTSVAIEGINFMLEYDTSVLNISSVTLDGGILENEDYNFGVNINNPGEIIAGFSANSDLFSGNGVICYLLFTVNQQAEPGDSGLLTFTQSEINEIIVPAEGGNFTVLNYVYSIDGNINYYSNISIIDDTDLTLSGDYTFSTNSDHDGTYSINNIPEGNYSLTAYKSNDLGGLSGLDASRVFRNSIGLYEFDCAEMIAADVTLDGSISGTDASRIARFAAGLIDSLNSYSHWMFIPETIEDCSDWPPIEYETMRYFNPLNSNQIDQNFIGFRLGDVSGNWDSILSRDESSDRDDPQAILPELEATAQTEINIPLTVNNLENLEGMDIKITFNPQILVINDVTLDNTILENQNYGLEINNNNPNELILIYYANSSLFSGSGTIANITAEITGNPGSSTDLEFTMFSVNEIDYISNTTNGSITVTETSINDNDIPHNSKKLELIPNPFNPETKISFSLDKEYELTLKIYNIKGQLIKDYPIRSYKSGSNSLYWKGTDNKGSFVTSGIYLFSLEGNNILLQKRGILLK